MATKIYNENDKLVEIQEDGETIWTEENTLRRPKISEESRQALLDAYTNNNPEKFMKHAIKILTGQTVEEASQ